MAERVWMIGLNNEEVELLIKQVEGYIQRHQDWLELERLQTSPNKDIYLQRIDKAKLLLARLKSHQDNISGMET